MRRPGCGSQHDLQNCPASQPGLDGGWWREYSHGRMLEARQENGLVFYDGLCGLCDRTVQFLLRRDPAQRLKFAPLQGETARQRTDLPSELRSMVFIAQPGTAQEKIYFRSEAALRLLDHVGGWWRIVSWLRLLPRPVRDWGYDVIARRRYRWFGKFDSCRVPAPEFRERFLP
jgi:predicted DCC family thiol-disulfide oxidoreductase YuxK